jgi:T5SS/PEP-CTERM-associated repeat protein
MVIDSNVPGLSVRAPCVCRGFAAVSAALSLTVAGLGQTPCENQWLQGDAIPGVDGRVNAMTVIDTDGSGPSPPELFIGGVFKVAGGVLASNIVRWDGASWRSLGSGTNLAVKALVPFDADGPGGMPPALIAGGDFTTVDGVPALRVAMWDGSSWSALGAGINGSVEALGVYDPDGPGPAAPNLIAAGLFTQAGARAASNIARWDGEQWSPMGTGMSSAVLALTVFQPDGELSPRLIAGGSFTTAGGLAASRVASWDGVSWSSIGGGVGGTVLALESFKALNASPRLVVGGQFASVSGGAVTARNVAAWDGKAWAAMGAGFQASVEAFKVADLDGSGPNPAELFASGNFLSSGSTTTRYAARWDGAAWRPLSGGTASSVLALEFFDSDPSGTGGGVLVAGGEFKNADGIPTRSMAGWDGARWSPFGAGTNAQVTAMAAFDPDGAGPEPVQLVVGGDFTTIGDTQANRIAIGNGLTWRPMGSGVNGSVRAFTNWDPDGPGPADAVLVIGGEFSQAGGAPAPDIATWNGSSYATIPGDGFNYSGVFALTTYDFDGPGPDPARLVAAGTFELFPPGESDYVRHLAYWRDGNWKPIGTGSMTEYPLSMTVFDFDGDGPEIPALVLGGSFIDIDVKPHLHIAAWRQSQWQSLGAGLGNDSSQVVLAVASFDPDGAGPARERLVAGGTFRFGGDGSPLNYIAQWDGAAWQPVGGGADRFVSRLLPYRLSPSDPARLLVLGPFASVGVVAAPSIASWDGVSWSTLGAGIGTTAGSAAIPAAAMVFQPADATSPKLFVAGNLTRAGGVVSASVAQWGNETAVWSGPRSGVFEADPAWACARSPGTLDRVRFDAVEAGYSPGSYAVTVGAGAVAPGTPVRVRTMHAATDDVTLNLMGSGLDLSGENPTLGGPALKIGGRPGFAASLRVSSQGGAPAAFSSRGLAVGGSPAARLELLASHARIDGPTSVGDAEGDGTLSVLDQSALEFSGSLVLGVEPQSDALLAVGGTAAAVICSQPEASIDIGLRGGAAVRLGGPSSVNTSASGPGTMLSSARLGTISFGTIGGSDGSCTITGSGSTWTTSQRKLYIGQAGAGEMTITSGGTLMTDSTEEVVVSRDPAASGSVLVSGAGSLWREATVPIAVGAGGKLSVEDGGRIEAPEVVLRRGSRLSGDSAVPTVRNAGVIDPGLQTGATATLTIEGDLESSLTQDGIAGTGVIAVDAASIGAGGSDLVHVTGHAALAGTLRFSLASGLDPLPGTRFTVLTAAGGMSGRFDVATFPGLSGRYFRVEYLAGDERTPASVSVVVETQTTGGFRSSTFAAAGQPADACLADLNNDSFPDLVLAVPDAQNAETQPGQLVVLLNAGAGAAGWNGFASAQLSFATGRLPVALAPGRFRGPASDIDVAVACAADNQVRLHRNDGTGGLTSSSAVPSGGLRPVALEAADLEADGDLDLVVANYGDIAPPPDVQLPDRGNARPMLNSGAGTFTLGPSLVTGWYPRDVALLDVNHDALPDIVTADSGTNEISLFQSLPPATGSPVYGAPLRRPTQFAPVVVEPGGLDNPKEINDVVVVSLGVQTAGAPGAISVFLGRPGPGGGFGPPAVLELPGRPRDLALLNLDDDDDTDLVALIEPTLGGVTSARLVRNNSDATPSGGVVLSLDPTPVGSGEPELLLAGDVDGDARDDLVLIGPDPARAAGGNTQSVINVTRSSPPCPGDLDADAVVAASDLARLLAVFGSPADSSPDAARSDLNADGVVDTRDLTRFLGRFGQSCR